jgi:serine/threonine protein kinase
VNLELTTKIAERLCASVSWGKPEYIDHGNSAAVYRVVHNTYGPTALKIYDPDFFKGDNATIEENRVALQQELRGHGHPNLIEIIDAGKIESDGTWYLLMEFCPWRSLEKRLADVPNNCVSALITKLAEAVQFLDERGLIHRDIKPANIAVSNDFRELKLLDLGVLRKIEPEIGSGTDGDEKRRFIATAQYSPPEYLIRNELPGREGFNAINVYQVGAVLHDLIMKEPIFSEDAETNNKFILFQAVKNKKPRVFNLEIPARLISICRNSLEKDPSRRISSVGITDFLTTVDDTEAVRKRLGVSDQTVGDLTPSLHVWRQKVRSLIATAARMERATLGAFTMPSRDFRGGTEWALRFDNANCTVTIRLETKSLALIVTIISDTDPEVVTTLFEINEGGTEIEFDLLPQVIAEHILYTVDLSVNYTADQ